MCRTPSQLSPVKHYQNDYTCRRRSRSAMAGRRCRNKPSPPRRSARPLRLGRRTHHEYKRQLNRVEPSRRHRRRCQTPRGVIVVLTGFCLIAVFAFVALSVDAGRMVLTETRMQNACRRGVAGRRAGNHAAVYAAGQGQGSANIDANSIAVTEATRDGRRKWPRPTACYIDPEVDVKFGKRVLQRRSNDTWPIQWDAHAVQRRAGRRPAAPTATCRRPTGNCRWRLAGRSAARRCR